MVRVLVVEDDPTVAEVVARYLARDGFFVDAVADGATALARARAQRPDLVVLDLMLPGVDGLEVCRRLRAEADVPVIVLTARGEEEDRIAGFAAGADDYVSKPFSPRELVARARAVARRAHAPDERRAMPRILEADGLCLDVAARTVERDGTPVRLTAREFDLLVFLMTHPRRAFSREELFAEVWGYDYGDTSTVTVHIRRLREKIERDPSRPTYITTVWSVGYRFDG